MSENTNEPLSKSIDPLQDFEELVMPLFQPLYAHALSLTQNQHQAEDLLQEVLMKAYRHFHQFKPGTNLRAWLYRIMVNEHISRYRKTKRLPQQTPFEGMEEEVQGQSTEELLHEHARTLEFAKYYLTPELSDQLSEELDERLKAAINGLPESFRIVLILNIMNDFTYKEISQVLEISEGTVMSRISRAKSMIRESLLRKGFPH